jgi:YHS domain-containing protein
MTTLKALLAATIVTGLTLAASAASAVDEYNVSTGATLTGAPLALRGSDAVALATDTTVTAGDATFTYDHDGVSYYFASKATMDRFAGDPDRYLPQYGGFCAFGVAVGKKLDADPHYADIVDGKLDVFLNALAYGKYLEDKAGTLAKAEANWPAMHRVAVEDVNG